MISPSTLNMIPTIQQYLSEQPIERAYLFGSYSRGEETPNSDIDLLVNYSNKSLSLLAISKIIVGLSKKLNRPVDIVEEDCLLNFAKESVNRDKILIYKKEQ